MPGTRNNPTEPQEDGIRRYGLGKFDTMLDSFLWTAALDGGPDEELGEVEGFGWYGLMIGDLLEAAGRVAKEEGDELTEEEREEMAATKAVIMSEDNQGFVSMDYFEDEKEAREKWAEIEAGYESFSSEEGEDGEGDEGEEEVE